MDMQTAPLTVSDAGEVLTLRRAAYVSQAQHTGDPYIPELMESLADVQADFTRPGVVVIGARDAGRLIGTIKVEVDGARATLSRFAVAPDRRGEGIGQQLLLSIVPHVSSGVSEVAIETGSGAVAAGELVSDRGSLGSLARAFIARIQPHLEAGSEKTD
ncbi:GNAT family N-acetyltransferase [Buchananella felis]|uniref:GNAT family N-acetyltransferase n=1 Tax=Buchananella felis TaxID=3231492 RepID=UPI003527DE99